MVFRISFPKGNVRRGPISAQSEAASSDRGFPSWNLAENDNEIQKTYQSDVLPKRWENIPYSKQPP
ncbi:hypothetical protein GCM10023155_39890 [Bremerella cremea]